MRKHEKLSAIRRVLGHEAFMKKDECVFFCPKHHHHKPKLSINVKTDMFHCWICGWKGNDLRQILFFKGKTNDAVRYTEENVTANRCNDDVEETYEAPILPSEFITLSSGKRSPYYDAALRYLISRGITIDDIFRYKLGYCEDGEYRHRVIIPSFDQDGHLNFFVGRSIYGNGRLSYKHGIFDKDIVFNDYLVDWDEPITLVEGPFDAMIAGENAIPLQGTALNEESLLFRKIVTSNIMVYVALDSDARDKQMDIVKKLLRYGVVAGWIDIDDHQDVCDMGKKRFIDAKSNAVRIESMFDVLKMRASA